MRQPLEHAWLDLDQCPPRVVWPSTYRALRNHLQCVQAKRVDAEEKGRIARRMRELARTPHPMLLTRISQLVASFDDLQRDMDVLHAVLDGDQGPASTRRKLGAAHLVFP